MRGLLETHGERVTWHGVAPRNTLAAAIDAADVALVPTRSSHTSGTGFDELYDYAARGRPIIVTHQSAMAAAAAIGVRVATTPEQLAAAVLDAASEPERAASARRGWAAGQSWTTRWATWSDVVLGRYPHT